MKTEQWSVTTEQKKTGKKDYVNIGDTPITVRVVGEPFTFFKVFANKTAVCVDEQTAQMLWKEYPKELRFPPKRNYAIKIINREDNLGYIMEFKWTVFNIIGTREGMEIGPENDWKIWKEGSGLNTRYSAVFMEETILTDQEQKHIDSLDEIIENNYKIHTLGDAKEKLQLG